MIVRAASWNEVQHMQSHDYMRDPREGDMWWGAWRRGIVIGRAAIHQMGASSYLFRSCIVMEQHRAQGVGEALVCARVAWARSLGADAIHCYAMHTRLYESLGFRIGMTYKIGTTKMTWRRSWG